jgi:GNAT superfamily N-acetyltransferase
MPWRPMTPQDLDAVQSLADRIHVDHPEDRHVFEERMRLYPQGCHILIEDGNAIGYALTHPWHAGLPPRLNALLVEIPREAATYYVHDVALLPEARGKGHAGAIVDLLADHAERTGYRTMSLVAVNGSQVFWERLGFRTQDNPGLRDKLSSYGPDATLMVRELKTRNG